MSVAPPDEFVESCEADIDYLQLDHIIEVEFNNDEENLIMILQAIQRQYNYLPGPTLSYLAVKIEVPLSKIYEVATFYSTFSLTPGAKHHFHLSGYRMPCSRC